MRRTAVVVAVAVALAAISAEEILERVDRVAAFASVSYEAEMTVLRPGRPARVKVFKAVAKGREKVFVEFTNPGDRGTRYLKVGQEFWVKGPYAEAATRLSGHLLREPMMGSDFSYEDSLGDERLSEMYTAVLEGEETVDGVRCHRLVLRARREGVAYPRRTVWVDAERFVVRRAVLHALSGMPLKELRVLEVGTVGGRPFPRRVRMIDLQRDGFVTELLVRSVEADVAVDDRVFTRRWLER